MGGCARIANDWSVAFTYAAEAHFGKVDVQAAAEQDALEFTCARRRPSLARLVRRAQPAQPRRGERGGAPHRDMHGLWGVVVVGAGGVGGGRRCTGATPADADAAAGERRRRREERARVARDGAGGRRHGARRRRGRRGRGERGRAVARGRGAGEGAGVQGGEAGEVIVAVEHSVGAGISCRAMTVVATTSGAGRWAQVRIVGRTEGQHLLARQQGRADGAVHRVGIAHDGRCGRTAARRGARARARVRAVRGTAFRGGTRTRSADGAGRRAGQAGAAVAEL